jgi:hypothetical protein
VLAKNDEFMRDATLELGRRHLGPFAPVEGERAAPLDDAASLEAVAAARAEEEPADRDAVGPRGLLARAVAKLDTRVSVALALAAMLLGTTAAVEWETGGALGFGARLALHAWIFASIAVLVVVGRRLQDRTGNESLAWVVAMSVLLALGSISDLLFG